MFHHQFNVLFLSEDLTNAGCWIWLSCLLCLLSLCSSVYPCLSWPYFWKGLTCLLFCRLPLIWAYLMFLIIMHFLARISQNWYASGASNQGYMLSVCLITGDINLDHSVKVASARFLHHIIFPLIINTYLGGDTFKFCSCPVPSQTCAH